MHRMNPTIKSLAVVILGGGLFVGGCAHKELASFQSIKNPEVAARLKSFVAEKEAQANAASSPDESSEFSAFFAVASRGNWLAVSNAFKELRQQASRGVAW